MVSEFSRDIADEKFQTQRFQPMSTGSTQYQGTDNPRCMNPSSVKHYSQESLQNPDFGLPQTKQSVELLKI